MNLLEISDLKISFGSSGSPDVLKGINLKVPANKIIGIVGESGSGKTVTAFSILRLLDKSAQINSGRILWNTGDWQQNLLELEEEAIRQIRGNEISMVFQEPMSALNPVLTVGFQASEVLRAHHSLSTDEIKYRVLNIFERVGLSELDRIYHSYPFELSGGQLQRVLIAQAVLNKPKLIIADEPTTALDVNLQRHILQLFKDLHAELQCSILFISHDLGLVRDLCHEIAVMKDGEIVEFNPTAQIFSSPTHPYTKGLIYCKPPLKKKVKRLPTVADFTHPEKEAKFIYEPNLVSYDSDQKTPHSPIVVIEDLHINYSVRSKFSNISKINHYAVKGVNLEILEGEVLGLVGESGSGKSSIARSIVNLVRPSKGSIIYKNQNLTALSDKEWKPLRKEIQMVFQDPYSSLNPKQRVGLAIQEPMEVHKMYHSKSEYKEKTIELLRLVGLEEHHYDRYPQQFSGGQRQRICIARALSLEPKLLICDEPVSALDVSVQAQILNLFQELQQKLKLSYLFISHDLAVVHFISDRIAVLKSGELVEVNISHDLINHPQHHYTSSLIAASPE